MTMYGIDEKVKEEILEANKKLNDEYVRIVANKTRLQLIAIGCVSAAMSIGLGVIVNHYAK